MTGQECVDAVISALQAGYRLLDTAMNYDNEREVGEAIRASGVPREEIVVTSKLPGRHHAYDDAVASVRTSLERLGLDYLDLHLIHWPNPSELHPYFPQVGMRAVNERLGIRTESWSPLGKRRAPSAEMDAITALGKPDGRLFGGDPDTHEEM